MNSKTSSITPMMAQFLDIKEGYKDALLFYRMGDFYEMFFDDAVAAAAALDIALTKRGKHLGQDIPMCGVPVHSSEGYLLSLIRKGFRVAVCEQLESPAEAKKRGSKSVVKRGVVRLVTPGTITEDSLLDARQHNYLASFSEVRGDSSLAWVDVSTGDFSVIKCPLVLLPPQLARLSPREVLLQEDQESDLHDLISEASAAPTPLSRASFDSEGAKSRLADLFGVQSLDAFGQFSRADLSAMGAIIDYLSLTQKGKLPLLRPPTQESQSRTMQIDAATRRNLELTHSLSGQREGSLLSVIDRTITGPGARLLQTRLSSPSTDIHTINVRLDVAEFFLSDHSLNSTMRDELRKSPDMDRALSRLSLDRGGPRDLAAIRNGLEQAATIHKMLEPFDLPERLVVFSANLQGFDQITSLLRTALIDEPPLLARDGGLVANGFVEDLDDARKLRDEGRGIIAEKQKEFASLAAVNSLKIKHNNVLGYFIETPSSHAERMLKPPLSDHFIHRQTTANSVRFTTLELSELETRILNAGGRAVELELEVFENLRREVLEQGTDISAAAKALAEIDLYAAFADLALSENWCRPVLEEGQAFHIKDGRHPVVEKALRREKGTPFVANDCDLTPETPDSACAWLLTGPNMAGKSTFLRQNALIALLAQIGSYVPASEARIGIVTQLFSRVGASDDLARGRSTFMVEMVETAAILNQAGVGALVILDEIGRGTATYDGLSIAWAALEHLHEVNSCRTLFATHYHELTVLSSQLSGLSNATVSVREWEGEVIFLHEVHKGAADRSYGVQVARLAGLPPTVVDRARLVLESLEKGEQGGAGKTAALIDDLPLFSASPVAPAAKSGPSEIEVRMDEIHPDDLSPKEALNLIYELKGLLKP